jgi:hypothetical protein
MCAVPPKPPGDFRRFFELKAVFEGLCNNSPAVDERMVEFFFTGDY